MKYLKLFENINEIDPFDEENWDEKEYEIPKTNLKRCGMCGTIINNKGVTINDLDLLNSLSDEEVDNLELDWCYNCGMEQMMEREPQQPTPEMYMDAGMTFENIESFEEDWEENIELEGNAISDYQLENLESLIYKIVNDNDYDLTRSEIPIGNLINIENLISKRIIVWDNNDKLVFGFECIYDKNKEGYFIEYWDKTGMQIKQGKYNIMKTLIEQWI